MAPGGISYASLIRVRAAWISAPGGSSHYARNSLLGSLSSVEMRVRVTFVCRIWGKVGSKLVEEECKESQHL